MSQMPWFRLFAASSLLLSSCGICVGGAVSWDLLANPPFASGAHVAVTQSESNSLIPISQNDRVRLESEYGYAQASFTGIAEYGRLGVTAKTAATTTSQSWGASANAFVRAEVIMEFTMTPIAPTKNGQSAHAIVPWNIHGNLSTFGAFNVADAAYSFFVAVNRSSPWTGFDAHSSGKMIGGVIVDPAETSLQVSYNFRFGDTIKLAIGAFASAKFDSTVPGGGSAEAEFGNTFLWGGITVTDPLGNPIEGFQALDALGRDWSQPLTAPEPSTFLQVISAMMSCVLAARQLKSRVQ